MAAFLILGVIKIPTFDTIEQALSYIEKSINKTLQKEVANQVKETMQDQIHETVYSVYNPQVYNRRGMENGLLDINNIQSTPIENGIEVKNVAPLNTEYGIASQDLFGETLDEIIVYGGDYYEFQGTGRGAYLQPRDFYTATIEELERSGLVISTLIDGLKKTGIEI